MATGDYCTLAELKRNVWPDGEVPDDVNDAVLENVITAVSREIDAYTGTSFYSPSSETRYFTAQDGRTCRIDPATTVTSVATDEELDRTYSTTWTLSTDYELWPYNVAGRGMPYTKIEVSPLGDKTFPTGSRGVKVVGVFCYNASASPSATLAEIKQVAMLKAVRLFKRKDAPYGVLGPTETGQVSVIPGFDPDELRILNNYRIIYT